LKGAGGLDYKVEASDSFFCLEKQNGRRNDHCEPLDVRQREKRKVWGPFGLGISKTLFGEETHETGGQGCSGSDRTQRSTLREWGKRAREPRPGGEKKGGWVPGEEIGRGFKSRGQKEGVFRLGVKRGGTITT